MQNGYLIENSNSQPIPDNITDLDLQNKLVDSIQDDLYQAGDVSHSFHS